MKTILTGRNYTDDGTPQRYEVVSEKIIITTGESVKMTYIEPKTGYTGHVIVANGRVSSPNLFSGHYYPTDYKLTGKDSI